MLVITFVVLPIGMTVVGKPKFCYVQAFLKDAPLMCEQSLLYQNSLPKTFLWLSIGSQNIILQDFCGHNNLLHDYTKF